MSSGLLFGKTLKAFEISAHLRFTKIPVAVFPLILAGSFCLSSCQQVAARISSAIFCSNLAVSPSTFVPYWAIRKPIRCAGHSLCTDTDMSSASKCFLLGTWSKFNDSPCPKLKPWPLLSCRIKPTKMHDLLKTKNCIHNTYRITLCSSGALCFYPLCLCRSFSMCLSVCLCLREHKLLVVQFFFQCFTFQTTHLHKLQANRLKHSGCIDISTANGCAICIEPTIKPRWSHFGRFHFSFCLRIKWKTTIKHRNTLKHTEKHKHT